MKIRKQVLLVEPNFPFPSKSKNKADLIHKNFVPIGLLKLGALYRDNGNKVKLVRGNKNKEELGFKPDVILVTSLFTYWSNHVWDCISHYRKLFPNSDIKLGGIYATLHSNTKKFKKLSKEFKVVVSKGINCKAEKYLPDYSLLPEVDYHATHMMRGCIRKCKFCGVWKLEPEITNKTKDEVINELKTIGKNRVIFYDNNILANPEIKEILRSFSGLKINGKPIWFESQSGFDGRILEKDSELAEFIKKITTITTPKHIFLFIFQLSPLIFIFRIFTPLKETRLPSGVLVYRLPSGRFCIIGFWHTPLPLYEESSTKPLNRIFL